MIVVAGGHAQGSPHSLPQWHKDFIAIPERRNHSSRSRDRLEAVASLRDLGIAVFGNRDWITPLTLLQGAGKAFQYDSRLDAQANC